MIDRHEGAVIDADVEKRLRERLAELYGSASVDPLLRGIRGLVARHRAQRSSVLSGPLWDQGDVVLVAYGDSVQSPSERPLATLRAFLATHLADTVSALHILPFFPSSSDDGFAVMDFRSVDPELGSWEDVERLGAKHDLIVDLVLNHVSRDHPWFTDFLNDSGAGRHFFIEVEPDAGLAMVVRPRNTPLVQDIHTQEGVRHVWTTFSADQIDVDYHNPDVLLEFLETLLFYVRKGARCIRLDAVAYMWKEPGTSCIHLPQTHSAVKVFREVLSCVEPEALLLTETNVPHAENISYFGAGDEAHIVYQFALPPLLLHAAHTGRTRYLQQWAQDLDPPPQGCTFLNFTASHDGVGLRPLEGLIPEDEIAAFLDAMRQRGGYVSTKTNSDGSSSPYELNISYFDALRDLSAAQDRHHIDRFLLTQTVCLSMMGIPAVYIHSMTATPNDTLGVERTGRTRSINRRKWDRRELEGLLSDASSPTSKVFVEYRRRIRIRRRQPAFHPEAPQAVLSLPEGLLGVRRWALDEKQIVVCLFNFTAHGETVRAADLDLSGAAGVDLLTGQTFGGGTDELELGPFQSRWLAVSPRG